MSYLEKLFDGKYIYTNNGQSYTEENFTIERELDLQSHLIFKAEVLSRVKTGEFLKLYITYEVTPSFDPVKVNIRRTLGPKESIENFDINLKTKNYVYTFKCGDINKSFEKIYTAKPHIATPAFSTSMLMVNQKKLDPVHLTHYNLLTTNNIWTYNGDPFENELYLQLQEIEAVKIEINQKELKANHCKLLTVNENGTIASQGHSIYLSKHYYLPYKSEFDNDLAIQIEYLKAYEDHMQKNFSE